MNTNIVIKKTSLGIADPVRRAAVRARGYKKLKCSDPRRHIPYIDRYGTLQDEMGTPIARGMRMQELETRLAMSVDPYKDIICLSASLPHHRTAEAMNIILDYCRENFQTFLSAFHKYNKKGEPQPHLHVDVFNDIPHHPLNRLVFLQEMKEEIGRRFAARGITFPEHIPRPRFELTGDALNAERRRKIEAEMKVAFQRSLYMSRSIDDWQDALAAQGLSVARTTKAGLITLANSDGYRMRLERLSEGEMKTRNDVERYLIAIEQDKEEANMGFKKAFDEDEDEEEGRRQELEDARRWEHIEEMARYKRQLQPSDPGHEEVKEVSMSDKEERALYNDYEEIIEDPRFSDTKSLQALFAEKGITLNIDDGASYIECKRGNAFLSQDILAIYGTLSVDELGEKNQAYHAAKAKKPAPSLAPGNLEQGEAAYARDYARSAAALTAAGLAPEQIQAQLCASGDEKSRWVALRARRDALRNGLSKKELYALENTAKKRGIDLSKALSAVQNSGKAMTSCAQGDAMPLLLALANIIGPILQAAKDKEEREAPMRKIREEAEKNEKEEKPVPDLPGKSNIDPNNANMPFSKSTEKAPIISIKPEVK